MLFSSGGSLEAHVVAELPAAVMDGLIGIDFCAQIETLGASCSPCTSGSGECLFWDAEGAGAELNGVDLVRRSPQDIANDPDC